MKTLQIFVILSIACYANSEDKCNAHNDSCNGCIREVGCSWSLNQNGDQDRSNCFSNTNSSVYKDDVYNPGSSVIVIEHAPVGGETVLSPQKVQAHLRLHTPIFFKVSFESNQVSLVTPHHQNLIVQLIRTRPEFATVRVEALSCPKESTAFRQTIPLRSTQGNQSVTLEVYFNCECPF